MKKYEVVSACYVPVGTGFRYKASGQIVTLSDEQAFLVAEHIKPVDPSGGVVKRNTEPESVEQPEAVRQHVVEEIAEGVSSDDGNPAAGDE